MSSHQHMHNNWIFKEKKKSKSDLEWKRVLNQTNCRRIHPSVIPSRLRRFLYFPPRKIPRGVQGSLLLLLLSRWESESDGEDEDDDDEHRQSKIRVHPSHQHGQCLAYLGPLSVARWAPAGCTHAPCSVQRAACTPPPASRVRCLCRFLWFGCCQTDALWNEKYLLKSRSSKTFICSTVSDQLSIILMLNV